MNSASPITAPFTSTTEISHGLVGKRILIFGVANRKSVAYHIGRVCESAGANCVYVVRNTAMRDSLRRSIFTAETPIFACDVAHDNEIDTLRRDLETYIADTGGEKFEGIVHSIAFADYDSDGVKPFHETTRAQFLQAIDISCFSLVAISNTLKDLLAPTASVVTISISTTRMASENYGFMGPVKAALDSTIVFLSKSFSTFSRIRFNAVGASPLKTSASAGIPDYIDAYLHAERATLRHTAVSTEEVARVAAFLLSPESSGIISQKLIVDAGMETNWFDRSLVFPK